ncbi:exonuclease domain-containing protein [Mycolicibacterium alvei]|uniref:DNA polymerase III subunit epsilon n=1 Tax=Mycolicibacterium alvei TaxID=67081 RepID=A0A6N4V163_9MYCO|nr:exonuclease domain-containing protein [Mycolicibacterium alvei]MCV6998921.1 DNA polymerase III subunit epsilon [Mycolicibacterium alvei]BBX30035.1 DNA polymerase III subunit epsilon [Mycolicibacterium alvei]
MPYAVIDFETTGVVPERTDRVVEVGIVLTDDTGRIEDEWTTLVNPNRDLGPTNIHGITAADVADAPVFADVSDHVLDMLDGRVVVAHNASFDMRFLHRELQLARYQIVERPAALCSMKWAGRMMGAAKLAHCCEALGISLVDAHSALGDAHATAELLPHLIGTCRTSSEWRADHQRCSTFTWPARLRRAIRVGTVRRGHTATDGHSWLKSVLRAAWIPGNPENEATYMTVLDNALLDRSISRSEGKQLLATAEAAGLARGTVAQLHQDYLRSVAVEALADGVVTDEERAELQSVATVLGLGAPYVDEALDWAKETAQDKDRGGAGFALCPGDRVVFTGEMSRPRDEWVAEICAAGLATGGISKSTRLVVAEDPDSLSRKAVKARQYGIPVVDEKTFARFFASYRAAH